MTLGSSMSHSSSKTRMSALEKLKQSNAAKLELETRKMEERIRSLKEKMLKEKEERERQGGTRWSSGRTGPLMTSNQKPFSLKKTSPKGSATKAPRRIKVLSDEPINKYIHKPKPKYSNDSATSCCGQCEVNSSVWVCRECSEHYCDACFNKFHQKGALKNHTKFKVEEGNITKTENQLRNPPSSGEAVPKNSPIRSYGETTDSPSNTNSHSNGLSLLNGSYNEEESAASFAQALQEWRKQGKTSKDSPRHHPACADTSCGTSTKSVNDMDNVNEIQISFRPSMSYGDRLYLKKSRQDPTMVARATVTRLREKEEKKHQLEENSEDEIKTLRGNQEHESNDYFSPNYREMIQSMVPTKSYPNDISTLRNNLPSQNVISVREVSPVEYNGVGDKGTTCIVEECDEEATDTKTRPASQHGYLSIQEMSSTGNFSEPRQASDLNHCSESLQTPRYVSPCINSKPFVLLATGKAKANKPTRQVNSAGRKPNKKIPTDKEKKNRPSQIPVYQAWKPKPTHKELTGFFLAGVEEPTCNEREQSVENGDDNDQFSSAMQFSLSKGNLSVAWHPQNSYPQTSPDTMESPNTPEKNLRMSSTTTHPGMNELIVSNPEENNLHRGTKPHNEEADLWSSSAVNHRSSDTRARQTGYGSNEDEKFQEYGQVDEDDFGTGNQDDDDRATLHDLAWELASSTGRLTRCEEDILNLERSDDEDSIEDKESGSGLTSPNTSERSPTIHESIMDDFEEMERKFMEEEF